jgi:hypothetical protein
MGTDIEAPKPFPDLFVLPESLLELAVSQFSLMSSELSIFNRRCSLSAINSYFHIREWDHLLDLCRYDISAASPLGDCDLAAGSAGRAVSCCRF